MASMLVEAVAARPCVGCGAPSGPLCGTCAARLPSPVAAAPIAGVDRVLAAWEYDGPARALVLGLKLRGDLACALPLVAAMRATAMRNGLCGTVLTWVPARRRDNRRRGYDHAEVLARSLARRLGLAVTGLIHRVSDRPDQSGLGAADRRRNLRGAFTAEGSDGPVVLVDDLVTTGATAAVCARALRRAGAPRVEVLAACRRS